jgi:hypothetical protein
MGSLKDIQPPQAIQDHWDAGILDEIARRIAKAAQTSDLTDDEVRAEPILCMLGSEYRPDCGLLFSGKPWPKKTVTLYPAVCMICSSEKWRKDVKNLCSLMDFLNRFLVKFGMTQPYVIVGDLARPAAASSSYLDNGHHSQDISFSHQTFTARYTIHADDTIGGMSMVDEQLYGLTTAHGIVDVLVDMEAKLRSGTPLASTSRRKKIAQHDAVTSEPWQSHELPDILAFASRGTRTGDYSLPDHAGDSADFALVPADESKYYWNVCDNPRTGHFSILTNVVHEDDLNDGEVWICHDSLRTPLGSTLLRGKGSVITMRHFMSTRKLYLDSFDYNGRLSQNSFDLPD